MSELVAASYNLEDALQRLALLAEDEKFKEAQDTAVREHVAIFFNGRFGYHKQFVVTIEVWVTHRDDTSVHHVEDPDGRDWRACVRHSDGTMEWQWCKTREEAVSWCERFNRSSS